MTFWWEAVACADSEAPQPSGTNQASGLSRTESLALARAKQDMRLKKPHYWAVFQAFLKHGDVRASRSEGKPDALTYRGFYADVARQLGLSSNTVKYRLQKAIPWFMNRVRYHVDRLEPSS